MHHSRRLWLGSLVELEPLERLQVKVLPPYVKQDHSVMIEGHCYSEYFALYADHWILARLYWFLKLEQNLWIACRCILDKGNKREALRGSSKQNQPSRCVPNRLYNAKQTAVQSLMRNSIIVLCVLGYYCPLGGKTQNSLFYFFFNNDIRQWFVSWCFPKKQSCTSSLQ